MASALHIAKTGLDAQQTRMSVIANNLANVSTTGFKKSRPAFEDLLYETVRQPGAASSQNTLSRRTASLSWASKSISYDSNKCPLLPPGAAQASSTRMPFFTSKKSFAYCAPAS